MNFQSVNLLNVQMNIISGNLFPSDNSRFSIGWKIYSIIVWIITISTVIAFFFGFIKVSQEKIISEGMIGIVFIVEVFFMFMRIHAHRGLAVQLIQKINDILRVQDETMKCVLMSTLKLMHSPLKFYWISCVITVIVWTVTPFIVQYKKDFFFYEDYRLPFVISKQPFSIKIFALGSIFLTIGSVCIIIKKSATDIYMMHLVLLVTAQYRYIAVKLKKVFQKENLQKSKTNSQKKFCSKKTNLWIEREMKLICWHHNNVIKLSLILNKLLAKNFSLIYINTVLRFSFIGVMLSTSMLLTSIEQISVFLFAGGEILQFYILCSTIQQLLDASTKITDMAFHEKWYQFGPSVKRTFLLIMLSNNLKCKFAAIERFNLSLSSFMTVINQAYSITLLCLKIIKK